MRDGDKGGDGCGGATSDAMAAMSTVVMATAAALEVLTSRGAHCPRYFRSISDCGLTKTKMPSSGTLSFFSLRGGMHLSASI